MRVPSRRQVWWWRGWQPESLAYAAAIGGALVVATALVAWARVGANAGVRQGAALALALNCLAAVAVGLALPAKDPIVALLLATAAESAAAGIALGRAPLLMASPPLVCAAWSVAIVDVLEGSAQWYAVPIGVAMLVVAAIGRWDLARTGRERRDPALLALEYAGMLAIVVPSLVETVTVSPARGLVGLTSGLLLAAWGVLTKVRRRLFMGVAAAVAAITLMIAGPIARLVPDVTGATLWILLVVAGLLLVALATTLERGRNRLGAALRRLDESLEGWE